MSSYRCNLASFLDAVFQARDVAGGWRDFLPYPKDYYAKQVPGFVQAPRNPLHGLGLCPFHESDNADAYLVIDLRNGGWFCSHSCGTGDLVEFHARRHGIELDAARCDLILSRGA